MVSTKDVAREAGVSIATVSRVINGTYMVTPKTCRLVNEAIKRLHYTPNAIARSLKINSTLTLGFLVSDISNNYFTGVAKAIEDSVEKEGYNVIMCSTNNKQEQERSYLQMLLSKQVDALFLNTTGKNDEYITNICKEVPTILLERRVENIDFCGDFITFDNYTSIDNLVCKLLSFNHEIIGVINGPMNISTAWERYEAFISSMKKQGYAINADYPYRYDADFSVEGGYNAAKYLLSCTNKPTALLIMNNMMAIGALKYLRQMEIDVPHDISLVCVGQIENADIIYVKPTYTSQNPTILGHRAAELVLSRIKNPELKNREEVLPTYFIDGGSTAMLNCRT